jgi:hypothetical protein
MIFKIWTRVIFWDHRGNTKQYRGVILWSPLILVYIYLKTHSVGGQIGKLALGHRFKPGLEYYTLVTQWSEWGSYVPSQESGGFTFYHPTKRKLPSFRDNKWRGLGTSYIIWLSNNVVSILGNGRQTWLLNTQTPEVHGCYM